MKTTKLVIGILSLIFFGILFVQYGIVGFGELLLGTGTIKGLAGIVLAFSMLIAGIVAISTCSKKAGGFVAAFFYIVGGVIGLSASTATGILDLWSMLSLLFAVIFILGSIFFMHKKKNKKQENPEN